MAPTRETLHVSFKRMLKHSVQQGRSWGLSPFCAATVPIHKTGTGTLLSPETTEGANPLLPACGQDRLHILRAFIDRLIPREASL
jgi:hypothetical protein